MTPSRVTSSAPPAADSRTASLIPRKLSGTLNPGSDWKPSTSTGSKGLRHSSNTCSGLVLWAAQEPERGSLEVDPTRLASLLGKLVFSSQ
eukprot:2078857-Prymnesium_polylepis.1